jgi:GMP synthase-like glutamine amidotransferase
MRLLVIQHDADKHLGLLEAPLSAAGLELDIRIAGRDDLAPDGHAGVVSLPGLANPGDGTRAVEDAGMTLRQALNLGLPVLGVCLGAELLAEALGGTTRRCQSEYGYFRVKLTEAAASDRLFSEVPSELLAFQAHDYAVELPPGAVALAYSESAIQAFRMGDRVWGIQFHPEAGAELIETWARFLGPGMEALGQVTSDVIARAHDEAVLYAGIAASIAAGFAGAVRGA